MRIVFFGTSLFSARILDFLCKQGCSVIAVVTRPDRAKGRDLKVGASPVKQLVCANYPHIPLFQPEKASDSVFCQTLKEFSSDLFLVVAYGEILKQPVLDIPSKACINIHTSLLPKYRGASPIQSCLMQGDRESGVTFMEMALKMDAGAILKQERVSVSSNANAEELESLLLEAAKGGLLDLLTHFDLYYKNRVPQKEEEATYVTKITQQHCIPDWNKTAQEMHNRVRALSPTPGIFIELQFGTDKKRLKILEACVELFAVEKPGQLFLERNEMKISCKNGFLVLLKVQLEGKKTMQIADFLRGISKHISLADPVA